VSRWRARERQQGDARPKALGGGSRSGRIDAHKETILAMLKATPDIAIEELRRSLAKKGLVSGEGTIRRFLVRHGITRKKRPRTPRGEPNGHPRECSSDAERSRGHGAQCC
jgi:transposase